MEIFNVIKRTARRIFTNDASGKTFSMSEIIDLFGNTYSGEQGSDLGETVYFICLKTLAEAVGKLPIYILDNDKRRINHETAWVVNVKPNPFMTPTQFKTYLEFSRNHYGNGYAYINRYPNGNIEGLYPLDPRRVQIWKNNTGTFTERQYFYFYTDDVTGQSYWLNPEDVLHLKSWVTEESGLAGKSVREILASNFAGLKASTNFLNDLYSKGLIANAVVHYIGDLSRQKQNVLLDKIQEQARERGRRLITLPQGFEVKPLNLTMQDAQFKELRQYTALQIAAAFGLSPTQINDYQKASYASSAAQNLSFYVNTLLYIITNFEQELNYKLLTRKEISAGLHYKFNVAVILRADPVQQAEMIQKLVTSGIYSINDALSLLDRESIGSTGDVRLINGSYVPLENVGVAYEKNKAGGDTDAENKE